METDLSGVSGAPSLEMKPGRNSSYTLAVSPRKRGKHTGFVSFIETAETQQEEKVKVFRCCVSFSLELICEPAAPVDVLHVECVTKSSVSIAIPISNPGVELLIVDVFLEGVDLTGSSSVSVPPLETVDYRATFSPVRVGKITGSVVFQSELLGEFWYQLELYALPPPVIRFPQARCQLDTWVRLNIPLVNPTAEVLELTVTNTNPRNYTPEMDSPDTLKLAPRSFTHLSVRFRPSSIGEENHQGKISFTSSQLQECCVFLSGRGLKPEREEPVCVSSVIGCSSSITLKVTNPTELPAALSITLTEEEPSGTSSCHPITDEKAFSCPLTLTEGEPISITQISGFSLTGFGPNRTHIRGRTSVDVPVAFTPDSMELQQAWLCITMTPISSQSSDTSHTSQEELETIRWVFPLCGIPVEVPVENAPLGLVQCEVGGQLEKTLDVQLTGCVSGSPDQEQVLMETFKVEVGSGKEPELSELKDCLIATIETARRDPENDIITLSLHLVYRPLRTCRRLSVLNVQSVSGRIWEFPLVLIASKPQVDDVIIIESAEFGTTSAVGFRLTSTTRSSEPFTTAFLPGSSSEFTVTPPSGMLPPTGTTGALIIVSFTPNASSRRRRARLAVQAADVEWTYEVRGRTPQDSHVL